MLCSNKHACLICHFNFVFFFSDTIYIFHFLVNLHIDEFVIDHPRATNTWRVSRAIYRSPKTVERARRHLVKNYIGPCVWKAI